MSCTHDPCTPSLIRWFPHGCLLLPLLVLSLLLSLLVSLLLFLLPPLLLSEVTFDFAFLPSLSSQEQSGVSRSRTFRQLFPDRQAKM